MNAKTLCLEGEAASRRFGRFRMFGAQSYAARCLLNTWCKQRMLNRTHAEHWSKCWKLTSGYPERKQLARKSKYRLSPNNMNIKRRCFQKKLSAHMRHDHMKQLLLEAPSLKERIHFIQAKQIRIRILMGKNQSQIRISEFPKWIINEHHLTYMSLIKLALLL